MFTAKGEKRLKGREVEVEGRQSREGYGEKWVARGEIEKSRERKKMKANKQRTNLGS